MVAADDRLEVDSEWAEFDFSGDSTGFLNDGSNFFDGKKEKEKKKKKKKDKGSESGSSDGMKKKKKKRQESDDDLKDFNSALFEKAIADVLGQDDAASGVTEDHAFINAFDDDKSEGYASFKASFENSVPEHAPRKQVDDFGDDSETGGFVVENDRKGERMKSFATRRRSVDDSDDLSFKSGRSARSAKSGSGKSNAETYRVNNHGGGRSVDMTPADIQDLHASDNSRSLDFSSYELDVHGDEFGDTATVSSELTGLTGVFSRMPTNFADDDDSESDEEGDAEVIQYPKYDPAYSKFMMMQNHPKKTKPKQNVKFGSITIRELERILGDNPSCKSGPPVSLGWKVASVKTHPTPDAHYKSRDRDPLPSAQFVMSRDYRHAMLLELGYSQREIATAVRSVIRDKNRRRTTVNNLGASSVVEEKMETAKNGLKRILFLKKSNS